MATSVLAGVRVQADGKGDALFATWRDVDGAGDEWLLWFKTLAGKCAAGGEVGANHHSPHKYQFKQPWNANTRVGTVRRTVR